MKSVLPKQTEVVIIGGGPVGLTASLLLDQWQVPHLVVEAQDPPNDHPQAHFISTRSMEVFRELGLDGQIRAAAAPLEEWRRHVYATGFTDGSPTSSSHGASPDSLLGLVDHFPSGPDYGVSPTWECNLSQPILRDRLRSAVAQRRWGRLLEGWRADLNENRRAVDVLLTPAISGASHKLRCRYVICADGAHSASRERLGITRIKRTPILQHLLNIHFFSHRLADRLQRRPTAMLYFVYSSQGIGVFVNHSLVRGEFVLQFPYFPPFEIPQAFDRPTCAEIIDQLVGAHVKVDIRSIRPWRLEAWVADRFQSGHGRCFLVGDAAHQILPAGGFGMNTGIAEVHNLAWKLARALRMEKVGTGDAAQPLLATYDTERREVADRTIALSRVNFDKTLKVAAAIGLNWRAARWMQTSVPRLPLPAALRRCLFRAGMRLGLEQMRLLDFDNPIGRFRRRRLRVLLSAPEQILPMRFPRQDLGVIYRRGWLQKGPGTDRRPPTTRSTARSPLFACETGAKLPHFFLRSVGADSPRVISSLDLPAFIDRRHDGPVHILLLIGRETVSPRHPASMIDSRFYPLEVVHIGDPGDQDAQTDFVRVGNEGLGRQLPSAVLLRPDGHVAWIAPSFDHRAQVP